MIVSKQLDQVLKLPLAFQFDLLLLGRVKLNFKTVLGFFTSFINVLDIQENLILFNLGPPFWRNLIIRTSNTQNSGFKKCTGACGSIHISLVCNSLKEPCLFQASILILLRLAVNRLIMISLQLTPFSLLDHLSYGQVLNIKTLPWGNARRKEILTSLFLFPLQCHKGNKSMGFFKELWKRK